MPCDGTQNPLCDSLNPCQRLFCVHIAIFCEDEGKPCLLLGMKSKTQEHNIRRTKGDQCPLLFICAFLCQYAAGIHNSGLCLLCFAAKLRP